MPATVKPKKFPPAPPAEPELPPQSLPWVSLLEPLGVVGLEALEPIFCAALIGEEPLLLIGPHGTGKSYVLERIAAVLALTWRHYNASLLNYDDLVGYPLPNAHGELDFVRTPASIWDAEIVFFDEISRCRPDLQNKLFPILHERRIQGIRLETLRYRWAAMNPPPDEEAAESSLYRGSEPLDAALADRFAFIVTMPGWSDFAPEAQERLIVAAQQPLDPAAGERLQRVIIEGRRRLPDLQTRLSSQLSRYVRIATDLCREANVDFSPRRAATLCRNILAVHAARSTIEPAATLADSAWLALSHSSPQAAYGKPPAVTKLYTVHRRAWQSAAVAEEDPRSRIWLERDPLLRALAAVREPTLAKEELSGIVADSLAAVPPGARHALAMRLFQSGEAGRLTAAVAEQTADLYATLVESPEIRETVAATHPRYRIWKQVTSTLAKSTAQGAAMRFVENLLTGLFAQKAFQTEADVERTAEAFEEALARTNVARPVGESTVLKRQSLPPKGNR